MRKKSFKRRLISCIVSLSMILSMTSGLGNVLGTYSKASAATSDKVWIATNAVSNGTFETGGVDGWNVTSSANASVSVKTDSYASNNKTNMLNVYLSASGDAVEISQTVSVSAGTYYMSCDFEGQSGSSPLTVSIGDNTITQSSLGGWDSWSTYKTSEFNIASDTTLNVTISGTASASFWGDIDNVVLYKAAEYTMSDLTTLVATVPSDYSDMGFTTNSVTTLTSALATANTLISQGDNADATAVVDAYTSLSAAINALSFDSDLFVKKISNYNENSSIRGMDVSSYLSIMDSFDAVNKAIAASSSSVTGSTVSTQSSVGFRDWNGNILTKQGFFNLLANSGVNYIRIRVWNNPYNSSSGYGYGGGNNDITKAIEIGKYATAAGMKTLIDFHFSDFWADPGKQKAPKAWSEYTTSQKKTAITEFVTNSLTSLVTDNSVNVAMVQIGNETNGKFCGESDWDNMNILFDAGCDAVHAFNSDILAAVHFTNPEKQGRLAGYASELASYDGDNDGTNEGVSYDVFATSYYPYWHGTMSNLTSVLSTIASTYDKYVLVAETSWANTYNDGDGHENTIDSAEDLGDYVDYNVTVQGQANEIRDVANAVNSVDVTLSNGDKAGLGFFYWESAWIPVESIYDTDGSLKSDSDNIYSSNQTIWETYGSGWASSAASEYDPDDAGTWYGGSAVDNQAVFDFNGSPLSSLNVFKYLKYGATSSNIAVDGYSCNGVTIQVGDTVDSSLPSTITVTYNNSATGTENVTWNTSDIENINEKAKSTDGIGNYTVNGYLPNSDNYAVKCTVTIEPANLISDSGFENSPSSWTISGTGADITNDDPKSGSKSLHFYYSDNMAFSASTSVTVTEAGYYNASIYLQGMSNAGARDGENIMLSATCGDGTVCTSSAVVLNGWLNWENASIKNIHITSDMITAGTATITLNISASLNSGAWGTIDDAYLYLAQKEIITPVTTPTASPVNTATITPVVTIAPTTATPTTPVNTATVAPVVTLAPATATPTTPVNTATVAPVVTLAPATATPTTPVNTATVAPVVTLAPATATPSSPANTASAAPTETAKTSSTPANTTSATVSPTITASASGISQNDSTVTTGTSVSLDIVKILSVKSKKKSMVTIKWKKTSSASGYQIVYSTSKKFKASFTKKHTIAGSSKTGCTLKKLKSKHRYYVKVRAYKVVNNKKVYGKYSTIKKITIK